MKILEKAIEYGFYLFLFLLPWQTRLIWHDAALNGFTWEYGRFSLYATQIILWLVLFGYFFWLVKSKKFFHGGGFNLKSQPALIYWLIFLFVLICGLSVFWSLSDSLAYYRWLVLAQATATMSMLLVFSFDYKKIAIAFVLSGVCQSLFAIWQFFSQLVPASKWLGLALHIPSMSGAIVLQTDSGRWLRAYGSFPHPNILGGFLNISFWFLLYLAYQAKTVKQRLFILFSLVLIISGLFFSFSRSAWISFVFGFILFFIWVVIKNNREIRNVFFKIALLVILLSLALGLVFSEAFLSRVSGDQDLKAASITSRIVFLNQAKTLIGDSPFLGNGIGNYTLGVFQKINPAWAGYLYQPVHNVYVLILAEVGLAGFLPFFSFLVLLFLASTKKISQVENIIFLVCLISILVIGLFDHYFWTIETGVILFWLIVGLNIKFLKNN